MVVLENHVHDAVLDYVVLLRPERQHSLPQRQPVFHTGERQHVSTAGSLAPLCGFAAQRLRSAKHCFRSSPPQDAALPCGGGSSSLLSMPVRLALLGNGHGPCGAAVWSASIARYARASGGQGKEPACAVIRLWMFLPQGRWSWCRESPCRGSWCICSWQRQSILQAAPRFQTTFPQCRHRAFRRRKQTCRQ